MPFQSNDILLAFKHIGVSELLNATEKQFAIFLVDSYNRKTGRCDPSEETAAHILKRSKRTIVRAGIRLAEVRFFRKNRHAGYNHCNSYEPSWEMFRELERVYKQRRRQWSERFERRKLSSLQGQDRHSESDRSVDSQRQRRHSVSDKIVTQTSSTNTFPPTFPVNMPPPTLPEVAPKVSLAPGKQTRLGNLERSEDASDREDNVELVNRARAAAEAAAVRRWNSDLLNHFRADPRLYAVIVDAMDSVMQGEATEAELKQTRGGLAYIVDELLRRGVIEAIPDPTRDDPKYGRPST